jgi:hypothetical protein
MLSGCIILITEIAAFDEDIVIRVSGSIQGRLKWSSSHELWVYKILKRDHAYLEVLARIRLRDECITENRLFC